MRDFKKLIVWEKAHKFAIKVYLLTKQFPKEELYGITSQIRRAVISIPTNIVEGCGRETSKEFSRFLSIAAGSASETEYLLILSKELELVANDLIEPLIYEVNEIKKMLNSFQIKIKTNS